MADVFDAYASADAWDGMFERPGDDEVRMTPLTLPGQTTASS